MSIKVRPIHVSHIAISAIWGGVITAITYLEVVHVSPFTQLDMFWVVLQNSAIALFNGYTVGKLKLTPEELEAEAAAPAKGA